MFFLVCSILVDCHFNKHDWVMEWGCWICIFCFIIGSLCDDKIWACNKVVKKKKDVWLKRITWDMKDEKKKGGRWDKRREGKKLNWRWKVEMMAVMKRFLCQRPLTLYDNLKKKIESKLSGKQWADKSDCKERKALERGC